MPETKEIIAIIAYWAVVAGAVFLEHRYLSRWPELARRGLGASTVLLPAGILALLGILDLLTYIVIVLAFVTAGGILALLIILECPPGLPNKEFRNNIERLVKHLNEKDR